MDLVHFTAETDPALVCVRGDTYPVVQHVWTNDDETPVDLTGAEIYVQFRDQIAGTVLAVGRTSGAPAAPGGVPEFEITITDADAGAWQWEQMPPAVTNALCPATQRRNILRWYDQQITWASGVVITPFGGRFEVSPDVTR